MAKVIKYQFVSAEVNRGTKANPVIEKIFLGKSMPYSEANEEIAKREAYNGEYTIEDDGQPEPDAAPTLEERVGTVEDDVADLSEALDMILNEVTE